MKPLPNRKLPIFQRHWARRMAVWNGAIWAIGNGMASSTLIIYLARELHSERLGLGISFIVAAPHIAGLLRLGAPVLIDQLGNRKRFCIITFLFGAMLLLALPWICAPGRLPTPGWSLGMLILLWCLYHLLQYLGMVGLWSWLADVAALPIRGRFLGRRERWLVAGQAVSAIVAGLFVWGFLETHPDMPKWIPYGIAGALGAVFMIASLAPLILMPSAQFRNSVDAAPRRVVSRMGTEQRGEAPRLRMPTRKWPRILQPFRDTRFLRLMLFGCWFSFFNGVTQSAQNFFPMQVLGISLFLALGLQTGMRMGQVGISPWCGALADRRGNRPVMVVSQLFVAAGLLCFAAATPERWQWIVGAWILWIAYAGMNVCLPNLMLKLSPERADTPYIAAFYAVSGVCYAASTILGGMLVDQCRGYELLLPGNLTLSFFTSLFIFGWLARSFGALLALMVIEPTRQHPAETRQESLQA